ncbi:MAG: hypothetical protein HWD58_10425 [Bacteroidota bacterium]|nr:MAG: hypothetical protein HWD58_10425 [Bacteroidota bacterium]
MGIQVAWPSNFPATLAPGTYWLVWQFAGSLASGPWQPPTNATSGNAMQYIGSTTTWSAVADGTSLLPREFPFQICGTAAIVAQL